MKAFEQLRGVVAPLNRMNIDTDAIIPKQFLKRIERSGFGQYLFFEWRFSEDGTEIPDFILNRDAYRNATILLAGANFGCGSSREHAPWALLDFGFKVILSTSYADIFYNNCFKNGILPIRLPEEVIFDLFKRVESAEGYMLTVDLENQTLSGDDGFSYRFDVDADRKEFLLKGLDDIGLTLMHEPEITAYEKARGIA